VPGFGAENEEKGLEAPGTPDADDVNTVVLIGPPSCGLGLLHQSLATRGVVSRVLASQTTAAQLLTIVNASPGILYLLETFALDEELLDTPGCRFHLCTPTIEHYDTRRKAGFRIRASGQKAARLALVSLSGSRRWSHSFIDESVEEMTAYYIQMFANINGPLLPEKEKCKPS
jgi:hypothetical protein